MATTKEESKSGLRLPGAHCSTITALQPSMGRLPTFGRLSTIGLPFFRRGTIDLLHRSMGQFPTFGRPSTAGWLSTVGRPSTAGCPSSAGRHSISGRLPPMVRLARAGDCKLSYVGKN